MALCDQLKQDFEQFLLFQCEFKSKNPDELISSAINLVKNCLTAREAILQFFYQFFDENCLLYINHQNLDNIGLDHVLARFLRYYNENDVKSQKFR